MVLSQVWASARARDPERREAYVGKQFQHFATWRGSLIHDVMASQFLASLRADGSLDAERLTTAAWDLAQRRFAFSAAHRYREPGMTKALAGEEFCALIEHESGQEIPAEHLERLGSSIGDCFAHLATQQAFLQDVGRGFDHVTEARLAFSLDGATIRATPDFVFLRPGGGPTIVDWKIAESESSDYSQQLYVYALAVARCGRWPIPRDDAIQLFEVNPLKNYIRRYSVDSSTLDRAEDFVYSSIVEMRGLIGEGHFADVDIDELEVASSPGTCHLCSFASQCRRLLSCSGRQKDAAVVQGRLL